MTLAVDFDRTIMDTDHPPPGHRLGNPLHGAVETLQKLHGMGFQIIIHSCRSNEGERSIKVMKDWLDHFQIPYDRIWGEPPCALGKPIADAYIDDRGLRFTSWEQVLEELDNYAR